MSRVRLLAFDIDGTISPAGEPAPPQVLDALRDCMAAGILIVPATGRRFSSIRNLCQRIGMTGPAITCNGAITLEVAGEAVTAAHFLNTDLYLKVLGALAGDNRFSLAIFTDTDIVCTGNHFASRALEAIGEPASRFAPSLEPLAAGRVAKVLAATPDEAALESAYKEYSELFGPRCSVTTTSREFLEFMAPGVSKGSALAELAAGRGIDRDQIACIGDSDNDLSLFAVAKHTFAVANATDRVLQTASKVVPSAAEAGVAWAIRRFILNGSH